MSHGNRRKLGHRQENTDTDLDSILNNSEKPKTITAKAIAGFAIIALAVMTKAPVAAAGNLDKRIREAEKLCRKGSVTEGRQRIKEILNEYPKCARAYVILGNSYINLDESLERGYKQAQGCYEKALTADPNYGEAYAHLASCANLAGQYTRAVELASKGLTVKEPCRDSHRQRAAAYDALRKYDLALKDVEEVLKACSQENRWQFVLMKGGIYENAKRFDEAMATYREAQKLRNDDSVKLRMVTCLRKAKRPAQAISLTNEMLKTNPEDEFALQLRGKIKLEAGDLKGAIADYTLAIESLPTATLLRERAKLYEKAGEKELARKDLKRAEEF